MLIPPALLQVCPERPETSKGLGRGEVAGGANQCRASAIFIMRAALAENGCLLFSYCSVSIVFSYHGMGNGEQHEDYLHAAVSAAATVASAPTNKMRLLHLG